MVFSTERILTNNLNIGFNVITCLSFKDRYNLCLTSKSLFETLFKIYQHNEIIKIKFEDYRLCDIWCNIKFRIDLRYSKIKDVSMLGNVHTLNLCWCSNITDVSMLGKVYSLILYNCLNIIDVSMLGTVHTLNLFWCNKITDVSMLGKVHTLILSKCTKITDVSMLRNVHNLKLCWCSNITDVSMLGNVINLYLYYCSNIPKYQIEKLKKTVKNLKY
jgi:hypothetical protein